jgi:hypothetical protein
MQRIVALAEQPAGEAHRVDRTVWKGSSAISCGTRPISERACRKSSTTSKPPTFAVPELALTRPQMIEISVVLPAPLGPSKARISPSSMSRLTFFSAWKPPSYCLDRFCTERMADMIFFLKKLEMNGPLRILQHWRLNRRKSRSPTIKG